MTLYISVRRAIIIGNQQNNRNDPPFEIRTHKQDTQPRRSHGEELTGKIRMVYNRREPLACGAVCWMEVDEPQIIPVSHMEPQQSPSSINLGVTEMIEIKDG